MVCIRKILLLGSGFVAAPCVEYLARKPENKITIGKVFYFQFIVFR
jgi:saccharopine dehydrogenase-like NADP-dependent oxidoreductase